MIPPLPYRTDEQFRAECERLVAVIDLRDTAPGCIPEPVETSEGVPTLAAAAA